MLCFSNFRSLVSDTSSENPPNFSWQEGLALLIVIIALSIFALLGLYFGLGATTQIRISDNYESRIQADMAARAGLNHARELMRGLEHNDLLRGADGVATSIYPPSTDISGQYAFRNWVSWSTARSLNVVNPASAVSGLPDDGLFNSGKIGTTPGTILIPGIGIALTAPDPYGAGTITTARYFVKVTDNDDGDGLPFTDSDGIVIVRSTGVAQTVRETSGGTVRANSVVVYEARFRESRTFDLDAPVILQGDTVAPAKPNMFNGNSFTIDGGANAYGIGTIDTAAGNTNDPTAQVVGALDTNQYNNVVGSGATVPAVGDVTPTSGDQLQLLDPNYLWNFAYNVMPSSSDAVYQGNQTWAGGNAPYLGTYPPTDASHRPRVTYVNGDLNLSGNISGAGVLFVTGELKGNGNLDWVGLILVVGKGYANLAGMKVGITGGLYVVNLQAGNPPTFGTAQFTIGGRSTITTTDAALHVGMGNLPAVQISWRQVTRVSDP